MKKRLLVTLSLCIILDWYIKNNVIPYKTAQPQQPTPVPLVVHHKSGTKKS